MLKILIDMQGCQTESRFRGIGRHVDALVHAMASQPQGHEIHLLLNGAFKDTVPALTHRFKSLLGEANIHVIDVVTPNALREHDNTWRNDASCLLREAYIDYIAPDVLFCSSFIEGYIDDSVLSIGRLATVPVVPISYDLIPLIWKAKYLGHDARFDAYYYNRLDEMRSAHGLIAISDSSSKEAQTYLGFGTDRVFTAPAAAGDKFCKLELDPQAIVGLRAGFGISRAFMFYTGGADHRKNLGRLVQAYASLSPSLRSEYQLVFAGHVQPSEVLRLRNIGQQHGLQDTDMVFLGYVTDDDLVLLYNLAHVFVFPSLHEGFGLPALESMQCGTPVICGDTSSLPEVVTCKRALFDPLSVPDMAEKMREVLEDSALHAELTTASLARLGAFSWEISAAIVLDALAQLITPKAAPLEHWAQTKARLDNVDARLFDALAGLPYSQDERSRIDVLRLAQAIANNRVHAEAHLRRAVPDGVISWRFEGPFDSSYSLALVNRELARAMSHLGHDVTMLSSEGPGDFTPSRKFLTENTDLDQMYRRALTQSVTASHVTSRNMYPPRTSDMVSQNNALHNYAWEETGFPQAYVDAFNESLQFLTVTAEHVKKILIDSGVKVPIAVVGNGVDHWLNVQADPDYMLEAGKVRLLHVSSCFPRKGADVLLESYGRAFTADDDVTLIIKTFDNPHNTVDQMLAEARKRFPNYPSVLIIKEDYTAEQLKALYEHCHILVAPSRAEGFGLPMAEAMLSGLHVITTGWSGQLDFCDPGQCDLIDFSFAHASTHEGVASSVWVDPDPEHLATLMKQVSSKCSMPGAVRPKPAPKLLSDFTWDGVARRNVQAARQLTANRAMTQPRIGWISTYNTRCGIATYSEHLVSVLGLPVTVLATRSDSKVRDDEHYVKRIWSEGQEHGQDDLLETIEALNLDVVVVQFNYGFFDFEKLNRMLHALNDQGRHVMVTLHATIDPAHAPTKKLALLVSGLARCARLLVHSIADLNRLKGLGLHHNAVLFPHGLLLPDAHKTSVRADFMHTGRLVIASYGFFLPHKGLLELIEACAILKRRGVAISLRLVNAEYPAPVSADLVRQAHARVHALGLQDEVSLNTAFLSDDDSLRLLSDADLIVYPYQQTGESASGAVRYGLALGTPVVVTPLSIFDDVDAAVFRLPGITPEDIAAGLQDLAHRVRNKTAETTEKMAAAQAWREAHAYPVLGRRLAGMIEAIYQDRKSA